LYLGLFNY